MGPKPRNYLKITKNIGNNPKLIKKEMEIEFGTYLWFYGPKRGNFCPIIAILAIWPKFVPKIAIKLTQKL